MERMMAKTSEKSRAGAGTDVPDQQPYMPGNEARKRGKIPSGAQRNQDYGKGRQSGIVADQSDREKAQEEELEMNERNH